MQIVYIKKRKLIRMLCAVNCIVNLHRETTMPSMACKLSSLKVITTEEFICSVRLSGEEKNVLRYILKAQDTSITCSLLSQVSNALFKNVLGSAENQWKISETWEQTHSTPT